MFSRKCGSRVTWLPLGWTIGITLLMLSIYIFATDYSKGIGASFRLIQTYIDNIQSNQLNMAVQRQQCFEQNFTDYVIDQSTPCRFCEGRSKTAGKWYNFSTETFRLYAYNAYYDDRPSLLSEPIIRIITVGDKYNAAKLRNVSCVVYHLEGSVSVQLEKPIGSGPFYGLERYVYGCSVPNGTKPLAVSIQGNTPVSSCVPVEYPIKPSTPGYFAVCVPLAFGDIDPLFLIEWMEMQKRLGISFVAFYDYTIGDAALKVLKHYEKEGFVDLRKTHAIYSYEGLERKIQHGLLLTDCLYRHMYAVKWIIINDVDEFFRPLKHNSLKELVDYLHKTITLASPTRPANFKLLNSYFFFEHPPDTNISSHLRLLQYRMRAPVNDGGHRVKPIINPMACTSVFNHFCLGLTPQYRKRGRNEQIRANVALNLHYRKCPHKPDKCEHDMNKSRIDNFMLEFKDDFKLKVETKVQEIMGELPENWY